MQWLAIVTENKPKDYGEITEISCFDESTFKTKMITFEILRTKKQIRLYQTLINIIIS